MRHKHYEAIVAFAEGKEIQWKDAKGKWVDWNSAENSPSFNPDTAWRVKPPVKKYRVALTCRGPVAYADPFWEKDIEQDFNFIRWITDWVEYE